MSQSSPSLVHHQCLTQFITLSFFDTLSSLGFQYATHLVFLLSKWVLDNDKWCSFRVAYVGSSTSLQTFNVTVPQRSVLHLQYSLSLSISSSLMDLNTIFMFTMIKFIFLIQTIVRNSRLILNYLLNIFTQVCHRQLELNMSQYPNLDFYSLNLPLSFISQQMAAPFF